jgi:hypothetical protein
LPTIDKVQDVPLITFVLAAAALVGALWVAVALDCWAVTEAPPHDADTQEIVAVELTVDDVGDVSMTPDQIEGLVGSMTTDGAYDGQVAYDAVTQRHPDATVIIPLGQRRFQTKPRRLSAIDIYGRLPSMGALIGSTARDIVDVVTSGRQCSDARPSSDGVFRLLSRRTDLRMSVFVRI